MALFSEKSLNLMPSQSLAGLSNALMVDKGAKQTELATTNSKVNKLQGTSVLRTPAAGRITVNAGGEPSAKQRQSSMTAPALAAANGAALLNDPTTNPTGLPVFVPGTVPTDTDSSDIDTMSAEITSYYGTTETPEAPITSTAISNLVEKRANLQTELNGINDNLATITVILEARATGESPNPQLNTASLGTDNLPPSLTKKIQKAAEETEKYIQNQIVAPYIENNKILTLLTAQASAITEGEVPTFDLEFGPPISTVGQFVLSEDGLYYNSRSAPVPDVIPYPTSSDSWELEFDSNRGGRGVTFNETEAEDDVGTIFDLDVSYQEENPQVQKFWKFDDILQQFEDDKISQLLEVSGYIQELKTNGYAASDAIVQTYAANLGAVGSVYATKVAKRKRQLTIAAIYGRNTFFVTDRDHPFGEGIFFRYTPAVGKAFEYKLEYDDIPEEERQVDFYNLEGGASAMFNTATREVTVDFSPANIIAKKGYWTQIPRIPLNDFSYLKETDISLGLQKKITLFSEDLDGVIAPYRARYVVAPPNVPNNTVENLAVDMIGFGDWVHRESNRSLSSTIPLYKSLTDDIVSKDLLICYNFLDPEAVTQPSGSLYALNNAAEGSTRLDAKLVGYDRSFVFPSGVGQGYFAGTVFDQQASQSVLYPDVKGSYVRLPNMTKDFEVYNTPYRGSSPLDNLFYSEAGVTIDFWAYVPNVHTGMTDQHRYRLVFANENSGPVSTDYVAAATQTYSQNVAQGTNLARSIGLIMGWRDAGSPTYTTAAGYSDLYSSGLEFCIAPTVGQNQYYTHNPAKSWGHSVCLAETWNPEVGSGVRSAPTASEVTPVGMFIPSSVTNSSGTSIKDVSSGYHHISVAFDYIKDTVKFHLDGELLTTSSITSVLGGNPNNTVLPTPAKINRAGEQAVPAFNDPTVESFLGTTLYDERCTPERVAFPVFTPWIIGGGYTDNLPKIPGTDYQPMGFLGSNTNNTHQNTRKGAEVSAVRIPDNGTGATFPVGQHWPPLASGKGGTLASRRYIPRSGLDGFIGSFKLYSRALTTIEAKINYDAQRGFFKNVLLPT